MSKPRPEICQALVSQPYTRSMCSVIIPAWLWLQGVEARRAEVRKYAGDPAYKKKVDEERRAKKKAEVQGPCQPPQVNLHACHVHHLHTCFASCLTNIWYTRQSQTQSSLLQPELVPISVCALSCSLSCMVC